MSDVINYTPPLTCKNFIKHYLPGELFQSWIVGPVGSGKTTALFFKLCFMAKLQAPGKDGIRRTRAVVVRNTNNQLKDTTLASWAYWFKDGQAGTWEKTEMKFTLRFDDVVCEVLFRPLDTPDDIARVLSLEVTFAILDEFVQIPREIINALSSRVGRWQPDKSVKVTNWGMWGASNPGNEDDWWFEYLYEGSNGVPPATKVDDLTRLDMLAAGEPVAAGLRNVFLFEQPSGFSPGAENLENLPGGRDYYVNQAVGKPKEWIRQFLEVRWGYSNVGEPVLKGFDPDDHVSKRDLLSYVIPSNRLVIGYDPGLAGSAMIIGQQNNDGGLFVFREIYARGLGTERFVRDKFLPLMRNAFPRNEFVIAPDPAANSRSQNNETTSIDILKKAPFKFDVDIVDFNNTLPPRLQAAEYFLMRRRGLLIDPSCKMLIRALSGGWRYTILRKGDARSVEPEKNDWSHPADAFCYLARYYHKGAQRAARSSERKPLPRFRNPYLAR